MVKVIIFSYLDFEVELSSGGTANLNPLASPSVIRTQHRPAHPVTLDKRQL